MKTSQELLAAMNEGLDPRAQSAFARTRHGGKTHLMYASGQGSSFCGIKRVAKIDGVALSRELFCDKCMPAAFLSNLEKR